MIKLAKAKSNKQINIDFLVKDAAQYDKLKKITFENGMYTEVYENFSNGRIDDCLADLGTFIDEYGKTRVVKEVTIQNYLNLFIIKWFSSALEVKSNSFEENIVLFDKLKSSKLIEEIFNSLEEEDRKKVYDRMLEKLNALLEISKQSADVREQIKKHIKNSDVENKDEIYSVFFNEEVNETNGDIQES